MAPFCQHRLGQIEWRLLYEPRNRAGALAFASRNITKAGGGMVGFNSKGDDLATLRLRARQCYCFVKGRDITDVVIAGADQQYFVLVGKHSRQCNRGCAVTLHRFKNDTRSGARHVFGQAIGPQRLRLVRF